MRKDRFFYNFYFYIWRQKVALQKIVTPNSEYKHLFILSPTSSGSTLLHQIISQSKTVAINNNLWTREGKDLPVVRELMQFQPTLNWNNQDGFDWSKIHKEFSKYWNPRKQIFLEKSPMFQAKYIAEEFDNTYFICLHRNPYSQIESYFRKSTLEKQASIEYAIDMLKQQKFNLENLKNSYNLSYTNLTNHPQKEINKICDWLPQLGSIKINKKYSAHNILGGKIPIQNLDPYKVKQLTKDDIKLINKTLIKHEELMTYLGYEYIL